MEGLKNRSIFNNRPLFFAAVFFGSGILVSYYTNLPALVSVLAFSMFILLSLLFKLIKIPCGPLVLLAVFFAGAFLIAHTMDRGDLTRYAERQVVISGHVCELPEKTDYGYTHILDHARIWGSGDIPGKVRLVSEKEYAYGSIIKLDTTLKIPPGAINPGGYDERFYLLERGIVYKAYAKSAQVLGKEEDIYGFLLKTRTAIQDLINAIFPQDARGLALGMFLGDTSGLSDETYAAFKATGAAHILAVSGLNVGIIIFVFYSFLKLLRVGKKPRYFLTLVFIAAYALLTGLGPSIVRASVMAVFLLTTQFYGQKTDPLIVLSAAFIFILAVNPMELFMPGFLLSFGAVFGMVTAGAWLYEKTPRWPKLLRDTASANFGASLGTAPILASRFYSVSIVSFIGNFFIVPASSAATILITVAVCLGAIWPPLAVPFVFLATGFIRIISDIVWLFNLIPFASLPVGALSAVAVALAFVFMLLLSQYILIKPGLKKILAFALLALIAVVMVFSYLPYDGLYLAYLDVGQGDSAFVRTPSGACFLVDGGDEWAAQDIVSFLDYKGCKLDFVFVTHAHDDHMGGIAQLVKQGRIKKIYTTQQVYDTQIFLHRAAMEVVKKGDTFYFDDVRIKVLNPASGPPAEDENDDSLVLMLEYRNYRCLFTGDISEKTEKTILYDIGKTDIMKAAHHGADSSSSAELLAKARPEYTVISVGRNTYGHPGKKALQRLLVYGEVFRTDQNHAVEFYIRDTIKAQPLFNN